MRKINRIISAFFCTLGALHGADCASYQSSTTTPSKYGLIQNVQNYSSNPFWNSNSPYNQTIPIPVYAQGANLNTAECKQTVSILVASYCASNNNCVGASLSNVRPTIMVQLSRLPGHNYATACAGFIDSEFNSYVSKYANAAPSNRATAFPSATTPNANANSQKVQLLTYEQGVAPWKQEMTDRQDELADLQSHGAAQAQLVRANFPTTIADVSFKDRINNKVAGYEPFKGKSAYQTITIEDEKTYLTRKQEKEKQLYEMEHERQEREEAAAKYQRDKDKMTKSKEDYCEQYPGDTEYCKKEPTPPKPQQPAPSPNGGGNNGNGTPPETPASGGDNNGNDEDEIVFVL